ncbi:hypothetical protein BC828DRAFT_393909, partial [Blastocladiella britannica]
MNHSTFVLMLLVHLVCVTAIDIVFFEFDFEAQTGEDCQYGSSARRIEASQAVEGACYQNPYDRYVGSVDFRGMLAASQASRQYLYYGGVWDDASCRRYHRRNVNIDCFRVTPFWTHVSEAAGDNVRSASWRREVIGDRRPPGRTELSQPEPTGLVARQPPAVGSGWSIVFTNATHIETIRVSDISIPAGHPQWPEVKAALRLLNDMHKEHGHDAAVSFARSNGHHVSTRVKVTGG